VSCHVERPLDDAVWQRYRRLIEQRPGGFRIASLMRPPAEGEDGASFVGRAREAAARGPYGHHIHWTSPTHARPTGPDPAGDVRREGAWLREQGLEPRFFCGGGWYIDEGVARALGELGCADCTATAFRPGYLAPGVPRLGLAEPAWLALDGVRLLELPTTHSLGLAARAVARQAPAGPGVHVYFHDTDLLDRRRRLALRATLTVLGRLRRPLDLAELAAEAADAPERSYESARG
jgi:hypothetical protein